MENKGFFDKIDWKQFEEIYKDWIFDINEFEYDKKLNDEAAELYYLDKIGYQY